MKKLILLIAAVLITVSVQAQEKKDNQYVVKGDVIEATLYHDNGEIAQTGSYTKQGDLTGLWMSYDRSGKKTAKAFYDQGKKVGTWFFWNDNTLTEVSYENARIASVNTWKNESSRIVSND